MASIGERVVQAIEERAKQNGTKPSWEADFLYISRKNMCDWRKGLGLPSTFFIQQMALNGYDVYWILTGERKDNA